MITALEAKLTAYRNRTRGYFHIAKSRIEEAAMLGNLECAIDINEIPGGSLGMLCEVAHLLNELGYHTVIDNQKRLHIYWGNKRPFCSEMTNDENDEE